MKLFKYAKEVYEDETTWRELYILSHNKGSIFRVLLGETTGWFSEGTTISLSFNTSAFICFEIHSSGKLISFGFLCDNFSITQYDT